MKLKISHKLIAAVGGVTIIIIAIFAYIIIESQRKALIAQVEHSAHQLSETVKSSTKYDMMLNQREHLLRIIDGIGQQEGIEKVRIFNKVGEIVYSSEHEEISRMVDKQAEACDKCHAGVKPRQGLSLQDRTRIFTGENNTKTLGIINPIYNEASCSQADCHAHSADEKILGVLDVTMNLDEVDTQISANEIKLALFAVSAIAAISVLLWFLVQRLVGRPVSQLVRATNIVATGDLEYQIKNNTNDELGHLGISFNEMTRKLADAQNQLYQYDKLASLGRLAAGIAHEINNPLTGVLTYSSFLLKRANDNSEMKNDLEVIVRETKRCREIVKGLLDFARPQPPKKTHVAINEVINDTLGIVANQLRLNKIDIQKELEEDLPEVHADANQIQQVLINLLVNALDAIGESGGVIKVATVQGNLNGRSYVVVRISDTGSGILRENLAKIFEPFYSTKGKKGTGLGLAVVWGIIEKHDGKIEVESEVGKGTTFTLYLSVASRLAPVVAEKEQVLESSV